MWIFVLDPFRRYAYGYCVPDIPPVLYLKSGLYKLFLKYFGKGKPFLADIRIDTKLDKSASRNSVIKEGGPVEDGYRKSVLYKPLLNKGGDFFPIIALLSSILAIAAFPAEAGFFSSIFSFFSGGFELREISQSEYPIEDQILLPLLGSIMPQGGMGGGDLPNELYIPLSVTQDSALVAIQNPAGTLPSLEQHGNIVLYTVQKGDTPSAIAKKFGVSVNTLLWANEVKSAGALKVGDELLILPISGVQYTVKKGDTIDSIAKKFKGDPLEIISFNGLAINESISVGQTLIIPDGELSAPASPASPGSSFVPSRFAGLPVFDGYYIRPIIGGRKSQGIHGYNGVDLAQKCGEPVLASASGAVIRARSEGWNYGYGQHIILSHPNQTQTLYAHLSRVFVSGGESVTQGAVIGFVGSTGKSTGCHVHFEVRGAKNPF